jgi:hypothetical protein
MAKQQGVVEEEERIRTQAVLATQTVQRCANKLAQRGKEERGREREKIHKRVRKNVISLFNMGIYIYIYFSSFFFILTP